MSSTADTGFVLRHERMIGETVREERLRQNLTQAELAERLHMHRSYLSALENGKTHESTRALFRCLRELGLELVVRPSQ